MPRMLAKLRPPPLCATLAAPDQQAVAILVDVANEYLGVLKLQRICHIDPAELQHGLFALGTVRKAFVAARADAWVRWVDHPIALLNAAAKKLAARLDGDDLDRMGVVS